MISVQKLHDDIQALFKGYPRVKVEVTLTPVKSFNIQTNRTQPAHLIHVKVSNIRSSVTYSTRYNLVDYLKRSPYFQNYNMYLIGLFGSWEVSYNMDYFIQCQPKFWEKIIFVTDGIIFD